MKTRPRPIYLIPQAAGQTVGSNLFHSFGRFNLDTGEVANFQSAIEYRPCLTPLSDITASSEFGVNGTVAINTPGVDPSRGLTQLPTNVVDPTKRIWHRVRSDRLC